MSKIVFFPGTDEIYEEIVEPVDFEALATELSILLERWLAFGEELRRRVDGIPFDLNFELSELLRETNCR